MNAIKMTLPPTEPISYPIQVGFDLLFHPEKWLPEACRTKRLVIITDDSVRELYGESLVLALQDYHPLLLSFLPGESSKNIQTAYHLQEEMLKHHCDRDTVILALGGGVVGDLSGFVASTYLRGVPYIQLPTTLLSMIDSSVGGKTGVNASAGKNLIGSFWQPLSVIVDLQCLMTLPDTHLVNGLIEAIKIFLTCDRNHFDYVRDHVDDVMNRERTVIQKIVEQAIRLKVSIVSVDEKEKNQRMILNVGHTIGHALEKVTDYTLLHGYAVASGILVEARISRLLGFLSDEDDQLIRQFFLSLGISGDVLKNKNIDAIIQATRSDKKMRSNQVRYVLLKKPGEIQRKNDIVAQVVPDEIVKQALIDVSEV
ncbi:MAG TPA: 3-dehydroquinate synthase [Gammaproteobacteria bacterium]|nr:3-dehydroquinate synthase [Gammaproteobacteria bacterium]